MFNLLKKYFKTGNYELYNFYFEYFFIRLDFINNEGNKFDVYILDNNFYKPSYLDNSNYLIYEFKNYLILLNSGHEDILLGLCKKLSDLIFIQYRNNIFLREKYYLDELVNLDINLKKRTLIYSNKNFTNPIKYLFKYKNFKKIKFYEEKNETIILDNYDGIIVLMHPNCEDLFKSDLNKLKLIKKYYIGYIDSLLDKNLLVKLIQKYKMEVISNNTLEDLVNMNNPFNVSFDKFNYNYLENFDLFGHSTNFKIGNVDNKYESDIVISVGPQRNIKFFLKNINFFKKYRCVLININHKSFKYKEDIEKLKKLKIDNFKFLDFLPQEEYNLYFNNTKVIIIPFIDCVNWWMTYTQGDVMMFGKALLVGDNNKTKFFQKYNKNGICNYGLLSDNYLEYIEKLILDDEYRKKVELESYLSYFKDFSIERMLLIFIKKIGNIKM